MQRFTLIGPDIMENVPLREIFNWGCGYDKAYVRNISDPTEIVQPLGCVWTSNCLHTDSVGLEVYKNTPSHVKSNYVMNIFLYVF